ncbi:DEAD/DEAH box helicase domain protein [Sesbania bispinosa]|nr:DEAD/DEAH box helicase domain protein [Sesbania bispinosa]
MAILVIKKWKLKKKKLVKEDKNWMKVMEVWVAPLLGRKISHKDATRGMENP